VAVLLEAARNVALAVEFVAGNMPMAAVELVDREMSCAVQHEEVVPCLLEEWAGHRTGESSAVGMKLGLVAGVALGKIQEAARSHLDMKGDSWADTVLVEDRAEEGVNWVRKWAKGVGRKVVAELDRNARNESSLEEVVDQVALVAEAVSQEAEHTDFGVMRSTPFGFALLDEAGEDCCTATGWIAGVLVIRSYVCHGPNVNDHGPEIPCEPLGDMSERHLRMM
jgi:hypothetical protein